MNEECGEAFKTLTYREPVQKHHCFGHPSELILLEKEGSHNPSATPKLNAILGGDMEKGRTVRCFLPCFEIHQCSTRYCLKRAVIYSGENNSAPLFIYFSVS